MVTKIFKSGNSLAVRIPASMSIGGPGTEVEVVLRAGQLQVSPRTRSLEGILDRFAAFDKGYMKEGRDRGPEPERDW